ncbi:uncharacterized protein N7511_003034 [Penicillium nucicola]|uniref:uncharacterized protein n=1 Tax=Penicillium nucicola TaxID=1850975 RepID=UPI00254551F5|nr:uncharacterized protein N7511_003034 [Penicillium nucicola]KAJ5770983.1 hypothetical protein N7511_003034 [Penicillium nucicola]
MSQPGWQIDIPGLSQLILNAGAYGLKQLALAGVDTHTIGCMLMIAEYTPASPEFRTKLNKTREEQRSEQLWLYKMIEIGASVNFLADQMLKTRAGENVVALMSAIAPVMNEESCIAVLSSLFEAAKVSLDNTPGLTQLQNIRRNLLPLASKTGMAEKVLHYHYFFSSLQKKSKPSVDPIMPYEAPAVPYEAIPAVKDIARIVQLVHKLIASGERQVIIFKGMRGAAWIAAYTSYVLGLSTCALDVDEGQVPITSSYDAAQIIFDVSSDENSGELYLEGGIEDLISFDHRAIDKCSGWFVDCSVVEFFNTHHPDFKTARHALFARISTFAAIDLFNRIADLITSFELSETDAARYKSGFGRNVGLEPYTMSVLVHIQARGLQILKILGFRPPKDGYRFQVSKFSDHLYCEGHLEDPDPIDEEFVNEKSEDGSDSDSRESDAGDSDQENNFFSNGFRSFARRFRKKRERKRATFKSRRGQYVALGGIQLDGKRDGKRAADDVEVERLRLYLDDPNSMELQQDLREATSDLSELSQTVETAVKFASKMAFTDWDQSLHTMSARTFSYKDIPKKSPKSTKFEGHIAEAIWLCSDGMSIDNIEQRMWTDDWVALDIEGVILIRNAALPASHTNLKGAFWAFAVGQSHTKASNSPKSGPTRLMHWVIILCFNIKTNFIGRR